MITTLKKLTVLLVAVTLSTMSLAWEPKKPITAYIGYAPGSGGELAFRAVTAEIERTTTARFVIITLPGLAGGLSVNKSSKEPADGYSLNVTGALPTYVLNEVFDAQAITWKANDLFPVTGLGTSPFAVVTLPNNPINNVSELVAQLRNPNKNINFGNTGGAQALLYGSIMSESAAQVDKVQTITYKGPGAVMQDILGGNIDYGTMPLAVASPLIDAGKLKLIGLSGNKKIAKYSNTQLVKDVLPNVPAITAMWNITLPANTPKEVADWYVNTFSKALDSKNVQQYFSDNYIHASDYMTPELQRKEINALRDRILPLARKLKIDLEKQ
jgi:tripartite-type tricarboxylate transporter receptor subunit TctC